MNTIVQNKINDSSIRDKLSAKISIIFSFYNEANVLSELIRRTTLTMESLVQSGRISCYEIIFVDDASTDESHELVTDAIRSNSKILLLRMSRNFGNSECALMGMRYATGDALVYLDADLQDPPELISDLVLKWQSEIDIEIVHTTRRRRAGESRFKLILTYMGYRLINRLSDVRLPVDTGDFKLLSRRAVSHLFLLDERLPYLRGMVAWIGFRQTFVFYDRDARYDGQTNTKFKVYSYRTIRGYLDRALISFTDIPLKVSLFIGILVSIISLGYILVIFFQKIMGWHEPGWPALMAAITFLGGITLSVLGVIGLYIGSIFHHVKGRPMAIVDTITMSNNATAHEVKPR